MPTGLHYHTEYLPSGRNDGVFCGLTKTNGAIYVARTLHQGYNVPGYAINGVGYFVSKELQQFQTSNFQVLVDASIKFAEQNYVNAMVADDEVDESIQIKIGSFIIEGKRFCGMVENNNTCYINFDDQVFSKNAPPFQIPVYSFSL